ncbi:MAG: hypothetical protein GF320_10390, partial [Armatimonadia bacterium]|nr:hypothetical protein [Armatimonadia bacterium]
PAPEAPEQPELAPPAQVDPPPPLTPELVEIEGPQPDLAGPAMAGVAAPAAEGNGEPASAPGPVLIEQPQPADDEPVLAGPETAMPRPQTASDGTPLAYLDGHALELTQPAHVENATVFVPIRDLVFAMGGSVEWDSVARKVTGRSAASTFAVSAESSAAMLDGEEVALEAPTRIVDDVLMVPLGFALQALGVEGAYDASAGVLEFVSPTE